MSRALSGNFDLRMHSSFRWNTTLCYIARWDLPPLLLFPTCQLGEVLLYQWPRQHAFVDWNQNGIMGCEMSPIEAENVTEVQPNDFESDDLSQVATQSHFLLLLHGSCTDCEPWITTYERWTLVLCSRDDIVFIKCPRSHAHHNNNVRHFARSEVCLVVPMMLVTY